MKSVKIVILSGLLIYSSLFAWDDLRNLEPIIIYGSKVSQFVDSRVDHIFVYAFDSQEQSWHQVTFQIDERDADGGYYGAKDNLFGSNEEILVMAQDAGDWASSYHWIDDEQSKSNIRYEIEVNDPFDPLEKKYVYIYKSSTLQIDTTVTQYINYIPHSKGKDTIEAVSYVEGHSGGIPQVWIIPDSAGGTGVDLLDRQKARVNGSYSLIDFKLNESNGLDNPRVSYLAGPIRITRRVKFDLKLGSVKVEEVSFDKQYYPHFIHALKANKKLKKDYGISLIRQSYDFSAEAAGMKFYNPFNSDILIDGKREVPDPTLFLEPEFNWYLVTGDQGSIVNIFEVEAIGSSQELYWWDDNEKGHTGDKTKDTGDKKSYGDVGVKLIGEDMTGSLGMPMHFYFLAANQDTAIGPALLENYKSPLSIQPAAENFTPPIMASLPDTSQKQGLTISVPLMIDEDITSAGLLSANVVINFDATIVQAISATTLGTIAESWGEPNITIGLDSILLHLQGTSPLVGTGEFVFLSFKVIGAEGTQSPLHIQQMTFNNGQILTDAHDGSITALAPAEVVIALPDTSQEKGLTISIPIRIGDVTGLDVTSVQISLNFNTAILDAASASTINTIASNWGEPLFTKKADGIEISMSGTSALEGDGELVYINFDVIGEPNQSTALTFTKALFNENVPVAAPQNGSFTTLAPPEVTISIPDTTGEQLSNVRIPIYVGDLSGLNVTSVQISLTFDGSVLSANDVSNIGTISSAWDAPEFDAGTSKIDISLTGSNPLADSGRLVDIEFKVTGHVGDTTTIHVSKIQFNKGNPSGVPTGGLFTVTPARVNVSLPNITDASGSTINVPITVEDLTPYNVLLTNMVVSFDPDILDAVDVRTMLTLTANWRTPIFNDYTDHVHIILRGDEPIQGAGILCYIVFNIIGPDSSSSPLHFKNFVFNNGSPIAVQSDGQVTVKGILHKLAITVPDTSGVENQSIKIPIIVDDLTGMDVSSARIRLIVDELVLNATGATTGGTLTSSWGNPEFEADGDRVSIKISGPTLTTGKGPFVYINFDIVGKPGYAGEIHFKNVLFNAGNPVAIPNDGLFTVVDQPSVELTIPDTTSDQGADIKIPIRIGDVTGMDMTTVQLTLSFADSILDATDVSSEGTMSAQWDSLKFSDESNSIKIEMSGTTPLTGAGDLVDVNFDVIGEPGDSTAIHFESVVFNNEIPIPVTDDGFLRVVGIIPVELASFEGIAHENKVTLNWITASESNNYGFEVQRSRFDINENRNWQVIGFVPGKGTTSIPQSYTFYDQNVKPGTYDYRLRQIDFDGTNAYSSIIAVTVIEPQAIRLEQNYPNPFNARTIIHYQIPEDSYVKLLIYNLLGNEIYTVVDENQPAGFYTAEWDGRDSRGNIVPSGVYVYLLKAGKVTLSNKMILLE